MPARPAAPRCCASSSRRPPAARCIRRPGLAPQPGSAPSSLLNPSPGAARISSPPGRSPGAGKNTTNKPSASKSSRVPPGKTPGDLGPPKECPVRGEGGCSGHLGQHPRAGWRIRGDFYWGMGQKITAEPLDATPCRLGGAGGAFGGCKQWGGEASPRAPSPLAGLRDALLHGHGRAAASQQPGSNPMGGTGCSAPKQHRSGWPPSAVPGQHPPEGDPAGALGHL